MLRIVSGKLRGRTLRTLKGQTARPTLEKTRETIFNILQSRYDLSDYEAIDLFAGSGALGFEAYSRGTRKVFFIEIDRNWFSLLKSNIQQLALEKYLTAAQMDAFKWLRKKSLSGQPKLFLLDPPYYSDLAQQTLDQLAERDDIPDKTVIVLETAKEIELVYADNFHVFRQKAIGKTRVDFIEIEKPAPVD